MISKIRAEVTNTIGKVIFNFNIIEEKLNSILTQYFQISKEKEEFFKTQFLNTSIINFNSKIKILKQILEELEIKNSKEIIKLLENCNRYRNAFAHCRVEFEQVTNQENHQIYLEICVIKPKLKNSMNAQGKVSDKEFYTLYEEFKNSVLEVEEELNKILHLL